MDDLGDMTDEEFNKKGEDDMPDLGVDLDNLEDSEWDDSSFDCD